MGAENLPYKVLRSGLDFSLALDAAKAGYKVSRIGWNGKGMYVYVRRDPVVQPYLCLYAADGKEYAWTVSQADVFAEDYCIVEGA
jgi:hypothetical protein